MFVVSVFNWVVILRNILEWFFSDSWINPRVICLFSLILCGFTILYRGEDLSSGKAVYLFLSASVGNLSGLYLIEAGENRFHVVVGHAVLYLFFAVGFGGAFFDF